MPTHDIQSDTDQLLDRLADRAIDLLVASTRRSKTFEEMLQQIRQRVDSIGASCDSTNAENLARLRGQLDAINGQLAAIGKLTAADENAWNEGKNARRCDLIDKEIEGTISAPERSELEILQAEATAYRDRVAPLPMAGALALHHELLEKKRQASKAN